MRYNRFSSYCLWALAIALSLTSFHCKANSPSPKQPGAEPNAVDPNTPEWTHPRSDERADSRAKMVQVLRKRYRMKDAGILAAMEAVPRHWFVPKSGQGSAYIDGPQPIGYGQTISQPYIVAVMTQVLELGSESKVLEIGTGSGYQAAVLTEFTPHVYTIEIVEPLGKRAMATFKERGYDTIHAKTGDGYKGWPEHAPFDAIIVTCAPDHIPKPLIQQLAVEGRIVIPVGNQWWSQDLLLVTKQKNGTLKRRSMMPVRFVPLTRDKD